MWYSPANRSPNSRFLRLENLISDQGDIALVIETNSTSPNTHKILSFSCLLPSPSQTDIALCYFEACGLNPCTNTFQLADVSDRHSLSQPLQPPSPSETPLVALVTKKKYKPVALKTHPVLGTLPSKFRIEQNIIGDPLADILTIPPILPPFTPRSRYTKERWTQTDNLHPLGFLWPVKWDLLHHFTSLQNEGFAWDDSERGHFCEDFFPPVKIPVIAHTPWIQQNILIPPGIYDQVCKIIWTKMDTGIYECSNSSYRSCWFCVPKKEATPFA